MGPHSCQAGDGRDAPQHQYSPSLPTPDKGVERPQGAPRMSPDTSEKDRPEISHQRLRAALAATNLGLWDWDLTTNRIFADRISCEFLGLGNEDNVFDIEKLRTGCHPDDVKAFGVGVRAILEGRATALRVVYRTLHADGRWVWIETCGSVTERDA